VSEPSFPRQQARTRRFTLGVPRAFTALIGPDGPLVLFLRSDTGTDPVTHLWRHDPATGRTERLVDARALGQDAGTLPPEERARRERAREQAEGIVTYAVDARGTVAAFALGGSLYTVEVATGAVASHPVAAPAFDPRPSPDGQTVAYHAADGLHLVVLEAGAGRPGRTRPLVAEPGVTWGRAEFVAAEEMGRSRGFWWSPDGRRLAVTRVDEREVAAWTIADPAHPASPAAVHRYPAAGTRNAAVSLWLVDLDDDGARTAVALDPAEDEYLAAVSWDDDPLTLLTQPRDQRAATVLTVDPATGGTSRVRRWTDPAWVELVPGSPGWVGARLVTVEDRHELGPGGARALCVDGTPVTPAGLQVREVLGVTSGRSRGRAAEDGASSIEVLASPAEDPTRIDVYTVECAPDGTCRSWSETAAEVPAIRRRVPGRRPRAGDGHDTPPWVEVTSVLDRPTPTVTVGWRTTDADGADRLHVHALEVVAETPLLAARPRLLRAGDRALSTALLLPTDDDGRGLLPVLLDPYGGPHAQRVLATHQAFLTSQWFADQGFAVLVVDGRGTPGRGPAWERAIHHDLATPVLADQVDALRAVAAEEPRLDLDRVAIRGWSFGGFLAALAVLRRPDVFRAAVAGAPVTDWHLYDTHYTERYLGHPATQPEAYRRSSLVDVDGRLPGAVAWAADRPPELLLIHGLADDNVVAAHTLRLSSALLADGRDHQVLPLSGVTHMTPQEVVAERLLTMQVAFLRRALAR